MSMLSGSVPIPHLQLFAVMETWQLVLLQWTVDIIHSISTGLARVTSSDMNPLEMWKDHFSLFVHGVSMTQV